MEVFQALLALAIFAALGISLIALIKPLPKLYLATRGRAVIALVVSIVVMVVYGSALTDSESSPRTTTRTAVPEEQEEPVIAIRAGDLHAQYAANEIAADTQYKDRIIQVHGTVEEIRKDLMGDPVVDLVVDQFGLHSVNCNFSKNSLTELAQLAIGQNVVIEGTGSGFIMTSVQLKKCRLIR